METKRHDLRADYLSGIDWFCLDGLYVIKAAATVAISPDDAGELGCGRRRKGGKSAYYINFRDIARYLGGANALFNRPRIERNSYHGAKFANGEMTNDGNI